jgi:hypothetical protein
MSWLRLERLDLEFLFCSVYFGLWGGSVYLGDKGTKSEAGIAALLGILAWSAARGGENTRGGL